MIEYKTIESLGNGSLLEARQNICNLLADYLSPHGFSVVERVGWDGSVILSMLLKYDGGGYLRLTFDHATVGPTILIGIAKENQEVIRQQEVRLMARSSVPHTAKLHMLLAKNSNGIILKFAGSDSMVENTPEFFLFGNLTNEDRVEYPIVYHGASTQPLYHPDGVATGYTFHDVNLYNLLPFGNEIMLNKHSLKIYDTVPNAYIDKIMTYNHIKLPRGEYNIGNKNYYVPSSSLYLLFEY